MDRKFWNIWQYQLMPVGFVSYWQTTYRRQGKIRWAKCSRFQPLEVFVEILSRCLGQKCLLFIIIKESHLYVFTGKFSRYSWKLWKTQMFSPANLSPFTVYHMFLACNETVSTFDINFSNKCHSINSDYGIYISLYDMSCVY